MKTELTTEQSAHLIDLGVDPQLAYYTQYNLDNVVLVENQYRFFNPDPKPIFTLTDILAILPTEIVADTIMGDDSTCELSIDWDTDMAKWFCGYRDLPRPIGVGEVPELIDSLYQLLCWVIENGHYNPKTDEK